MNSNSISQQSTPLEANLCIILIREELKSWKFFSQLLQAGIDANNYQIDLSEAIFPLVGITDPSNEFHKFYHDLMKKHSSEMKLEEEDMAPRAYIIWKELTAKVKSI